MVLSVATCIQNSKYFQDFQSSYPTYNKISSTSLLYPYSDPDKFYGK